MKNILTLLWLIPMVVCAQKSYPIENMNLEAKPGDNFMEYATGQWIKNHPLKGNEYENGAFRGCRDSVTARMNKILTELLVLPQKPGSIGDQVSILYKQYSDTAHRNELGIAPIQEELQAIRQAQTKEELQAAMAKLSRRGAGTSLFVWSINTDLLHADSNIVFTSKYDYVLPTYYFRSHKRKIRNIRQAYETYMRQLFEATGLDASTAETRMKRTIGIERQLIKAEDLTWWQFLKSKDFKNMVHKHTRAELEKKYSEIAWAKIFETSDGPMDVRVVDVRSPKALKIANRVLQKSELEELKDWAEYRLLRYRGPFLSQDLRRQYRTFIGQLQGKTNDQEQWKTNTEFLSVYLEMPMGQLYSERFFAPEHKVRIQKIIENITDAFRQRLEQNTWMTDETKQMALTKLRNIVWEVAYPDKWDSTEGLNISKQNTLCENLAQLQEFQWNQRVQQRLNQPVDRHHWTTGPQTVNGFYNPTENRVTLFAGILQPPFFDPSADEAINYGAIGTVIAHELTHGYDPNGCQFDSVGNVHDWWTRKDKHAFSRRTKVLRRHFDNLKQGKEKVDGARTLAENVADNGGLNIALEAMRRAGINDTINGQSAEQRFFLSYARMWARNCKPDYLWYVVHNDTHAPSETRVNGALPHIDAWYDAFGINHGDSLYLSKGKRAAIW